MQFVFYIIYSAKLDKYYLGHTKDIHIRIGQHNAGISAFTSAANDWQLVYSESFPTRDGARKREADVKRKKSRKYIEWLISSAG